MVLSRIHLLFDQLFMGKIYSETQLGWIPIFSCR